MVIIMIKLPKFPKKSKERLNIKHKISKGNKTQKIKNVLIGAFMVPVIFIVILGVVSYQRASDTIVEKYKESSMNKQELC